MYLFYTPDIETIQCLSEEESAHCVRVLRYGVGDEILLTDGRGSTYTARIVSAHPKQCVFEVLSHERQQPSHDFHLHIAIAPTKHIERLEWMIEKCTEIGIDEITPILCRYSERRDVRIDRLQKVMLSAAKQSLTPYLPVLHAMTPIEQVIAAAQAQDHQDAFIAHCLKDQKAELASLIRPKRDVIVLIGPEGDFSEQEVEMALQSGFRAVSLGSSRLRTETAGVVACHTAILCNTLNR